MKFVDGGNGKTFLFLCLGAIPVGAALGFLIQFFVV